jgi:hypothetical protein
VKVVYIRLERRRDDDNPPARIKVQKTSKVFEVNVPVHVSMKYSLWKHLRTTTSLLIPFETNRESCFSSGTSIRQKNGRLIIATFFTPGNIHACTGIYIETSLLYTVYRSTLAADRKVRRRLEDDSFECDTGLTGR